MQRSAEEALGGWGWVYVALVSSALYIDYHGFSFAQLSFVLLVGLLFGWVVKRTGSLLG